MNDLSWDLMVELRREMLEAQRIRAQMIGYKITLISAGVGVVIANQASVPRWILVLPALASVFFDFLITSQSIGIKRIAFYIRAYLEPRLRASSGWPSDQPLWEEHMSKPQNKQVLSLIANLGITVLVSVPAAYLVLIEFRPIVGAISLVLSLAALLGVDAWYFFVPRRVLEASPQVVVVHPSLGDP